MLYIYPQSVYSVCTDVIIRAYRKIGIDLQMFTFVMVFT
ncbi:MAG: DUF1287 domain-containing protein [Flavobacteriales bacterium]